MRHVPRSTALWPTLIALTVAGCGGPEPQEGERAEATTGSERAPAPARPTGPAPSFLPLGHKLLIRADILRVRRSPLAPDLQSAIRSNASWRTMSGRSGVDPIRDIDLLAMGSDALYSFRRVAVLRTPFDEGEIRQRVLAMAIERGEQPDWREVGGMPVISWPMQREGMPPYSVMITASHEVVLAPDDEMPRIASVARDHALRRDDPEQVIEPSLLGFRENEIATFEIDDQLPTFEGYPEPPARARLEIDQGPTDEALLFMHAEFADAPRASAAHAWLDGQRTYWAQQAMVRAIGMNRPLDSARFELSGPSLDVRLDLTVEEIRRVLGLMALQQLSQSQ